MRSTPWRPNGTRPSPALRAPVGTYAVVASFDGRTSLEQPITITKAGPNALTFTF
jgi:hypothetical protein